jgi:hypothetical protein
LWLLPSGPDQVGEASARRRSPRRHMADREKSRKCGASAGDMAPNLKKGSRTLGNRALS